MPFAIDDLTSVIAHWSADAITGLVDGDPVDSMPDSISSWDLAGTTTTRPLYRPTSAINSLPAVEFDGTNDWLQTASSKAITMPRCVVAEVFRITTLQNYNPAFYLATTPGLPTHNGSATLLQHITGYTDGHTLYGGYNGGATYTLTRTGLTAASTTYMTVTAYSQQMTWQRMNGLGVRTHSSTGGSPDLSSGTVYASFGDNNLTLSFSGLMSEIVLFEDGTQSESLYIEGVLAHKYGITLPTTHPFYAAAPTSGPPTAGASQTFHPLGGS